MFGMVGLIECFGWVGVWCPNISGGENGDGGDWFVIVGKICRGVLLMCFFLAANPRYFSL